MGMMALALWLFNLAVVLGGYALLLVLLSLGVRRHAGAKRFVLVSAAAIALGVLISYFLLDALMGELPRKLYIFTAFTEITWRPLMFWLALAAVILYRVAYRLRTQKVAFLCFGSAALACAYAGVVQAIAGLFFGNDILQARGIQLQY